MWGPCPSLDKMRTILTWRAKALSVTLILALTVAACADEGSSGDDRPLVVVTTTILGDVVTRVGGGAVRVVVLMPPGADPHEYAASASDAATMHDASLVVTNGLGLESGLADALATLDGRVSVLAVGDGVDPRYFAGGVADPHFWTDLSRMSVATTAIRDALVAAAPGSAAEIEAATVAYQQELADLDDEVMALLAGIPAERRLLVANHDFLGYFADRYGFEVVGSLIPGGSTIEEPGAAELAALADLIVERGVRAVFAEGTKPTDLAEALAAEAGGLPLVVLQSGALPEGGSYIDLVRGDATLIADALK